MIFLKGFISVIILTISGINLSLVDIKKREYIFWLFAITIATSAIAILSEMIGGIISILLVIFMLYKLSKKLFSSIIYTIISMIISVFSDNVISSIITKGFENGETIRNSFDTDIISYLFVSVFIFLLVFAISKIVGQFIHKKSLINQVTSNKKFGFILSAFLIITFTFIYASIFIDYEGNPMLTVGVYLLYFTFILIIMFVLIAITKKETAFISKKRELEQLTQYTQNLEILYNDMKRFRHDYMNVLASLMGHIESKDMSSLTKYFNEKIIPFSNKLKANDNKLGLLSFIKIPEVKGLVAFKVIYAQEHGVKVFIDIAEEININKVEIIDLCRMLGILLDNAYEGAINSVNPTLRLAFVNNTNSTMIIVTNSYDENIPPIHKMYTEGFSTKGENRGLGLSNLKEIVNAYRGISIDTRIDKTEFKQIIEINNRS